MTSPITVSVPATSANLGPGFDCLGLALDLWNQAEFSLADQGFHIEVEGFGADTLPRNERNLILQSVRALYARIQIPTPRGMNIYCKNAFPPGSGLGSSSSAILLGLLGANSLLDHPLTPVEILSFANEIEGHPDNVTPALWGGLTISTIENHQVIARKIPIRPLVIAVVVPQFNLSTHAARAALPKHVRLTDAVYNLGRTPLVVEAFRTGDLDLLRHVMDDRLHQPYRLPLIPGALNVFEAARAVGVGAVALSGAGPGVIAFTDSEVVAKKSTEAMSEAFQAAGLPCWQYVTSVSENGAYGK